MKRKLKTFINSIVKFCFHDTLTTIFCSQNVQNAKAGIPATQISSSAAANLNGMFGYNDMSFNKPISTISALTANTLSPLTTASLSNLNLPSVDLSSMVLQANSTRSSLNRPCSYTIKLYHAVGGYVAEILKHHEDDQSSRDYSTLKTGSLHILDSEKLGEQLEKAIAYESLKQ